MAITSTLIELDRAADTFLPFTYRDKASSLPIDIATADIKLVVKGGFTLVPTTNPANPLGRLFHFTEEHAALLGSKPRDFMVTLSQDGIDSVLWRGQIVAIGFAR